MAHPEVGFGTEPRGAVHYDAGRNEAMVKNPNPEVGVRAMRCEAGHHDAKRGEAVLKVPHPGVGLRSGAMRCAAKRGGAAFPRCPPWGGPRKLCSTWRHLASRGVASRKPPQPELGTRSNAKRGHTKQSRAQPSEATALRPLRSPYRTSRNGQAMHQCRLLRQYLARSENHPCR